MRRTADRLSVFALALILQAALQYLLRPPPMVGEWPGRAMSRSRYLETLHPRLRVFAPSPARRFNPSGSAD